MKSRKQTLKENHPPAVFHFGLVKEGCPFLGKRKPWMGLSFQRGRIVRGIGNGLVGCGRWYGSARKFRKAPSVKYVLVIVLSGGQKLLRF